MADDEPVGGVHAHRLLISFPMHNFFSDCVFFFGVSGLGFYCLSNPIYTRLMLHLAGGLAWICENHALTPFPLFVSPIVLYMLRVLDDLCDLIDTIASVRCLGLLFCWFDFSVFSSVQLGPGQKCASHVFLSPFFY